jgi:hypothetical protein
MFVDDVIDEKLGRARQHQTADLVDKHQQESNGEHAPPRTHHLADIGPQFAQALGRALFGSFRIHKQIKLLYWMRSYRRWMPS